MLVDRLFKNVKLNANDTVHEHHGNPANAAGYKFLVTAWSIEATLFYLGAPAQEINEFLNVIESSRSDVVA